MHVRHHSLIADGQDGERKKENNLQVRSRFTGPRGLQGKEELNSSKIDFLLTSFNAQ
jgi:hypothetical protein